MARDEAVGIGMAAWTITATLLLKLVNRGVLARTDAAALIDDALLEMEAACPPDHPDYQVWTAARRSLDELLRQLRKVPLEPFEPRALDE